MTDLRGVIFSDTERISPGISRINIICLINMQVRTLPHGSKVSLET